MINFKPCVAEGFTNTQLTEPMNSVEYLLKYPTITKKLTHLKLYNVKWQDDQLINYTT